MREPLVKNRQRPVDPEREYEQMHIDEQGQLPRDEGSQERVTEALGAISCGCSSCGEKESASEGGPSHPNHTHEGPVGLASLVEVLVGLALLLLLAFTDILAKPYDTYALIGVFLVIGRYVFFAALSNLRKGRWMDENFLMALATLGALAMGDYREALGVMLFYRIGILFEEGATQRSRRDILQVMDMRPHTVTVVTDSGAKEELRAEEACRGQLIQIRPGDRIPLESTVIRGESRVDTSPVTGEPKPVAIREGSALISGCINLSGTLVVRVDKVLEESFVTTMLTLVEEAAARKPKVDRFITRFARYYTPIVIAITALTILVPGFVTSDWSYWLYTGLTFLVISCPCALVLSIPLAFFAGIGGGSRWGILFKGGLAMEQMRAIRVIALDKTGTLTKGAFAVQEVEGFGHWSEEEILRLCASAEEGSSHPIGQSIREKALAKGLLLTAPQEGQEKAGEGLQALVEGHRLACGNRRLLASLGIPGPEHLIVSTGASEVFVVIDGFLAGRILIRDVLKEDACQAVASLQKKGYTVVMVTGDTVESAQAIAEEASIDAVYGGLLPADKVATLASLRHQYGPVMFVGDGINDAPVLAGADVGCAMGSGADAALEAADVVFMNSEVAAVERALRLAKKTMTIAWQNVIFAIAVKFLVMMLGFTGHASLWLAIFADTGVMILCVLNAIRLLYGGPKRTEALPLREESFLGHP